MKKINKKYLKCPICGRLNKRGGNSIFCCGDCAIKHWNIKRKENPEKHYKYNKKWKLNNPEKVRCYLKKWRKKKLKDVCFRLTSNIRSYISISVNNKGDEYKKYKLENWLGYTIEDLKKYLEKKFDNKMNWNNYGKYWSIDHIKPISFFHYKSILDSEFKECWSLENLQPLEKIANIKKGNYFLNNPVDN